MVTLMLSMFVMGCTSSHRAAATDQAVRFAVLGNTAAVTPETSKRLDAMTCATERAAAAAGMSTMLAATADLGLPSNGATVLRARATRVRWQSGPPSAEVVVAVTYLLDDGTRERAVTPVVVREEAGAWCVVPPWVALGAAPKEQAPPASP